MKRPVLLRTRALALFLFFPLATVPIIYGAKEFETIASWYGPGFQGRRTANGERFDQNAMTAASKTLPFGTRVVVYNPRNDRQCVVTINDRGPYVPGRGIDLSHAAARKLGIGGVAPVICYAGGSSYADIAHKDHHHQRTEETAPLAVPLPESRSRSDIAVDNGSDRATAASHSGSTEALVASIPPQSTEPITTAQPTSESQPHVPSAQAPERTPHNTASVSPVNEQSVARANNQLTEAPSQSNSPLGKTIQVIRLNTPQTTEQLAPVAQHNENAKAVENNPTLTNDSYNMSAIRKPGALLAAAMATPANYPTSSLPPQEVVNYAVQHRQIQIVQPSMLPRAGFVEVQSPPTITTTRIETPRAIRRATSRSHVVAYQHHIRRHSYLRASHSGDLVDDLAYGVTHVCKKIFASL
jgi:rare lipoprotein A (peptidoglycan hydrolase)